MKKYTYFNLPVLIYIFYLGVYNAFVWKKNPVLLNISL